MARSSFFNPIQASNKQCKIALKPSEDENECGSMFEQLPICIGARVICRRNIDFDGSMVNGTEATVNDIVWDNSDHIILPMSRRCIFPNLDRAITTTLPKYIELKLLDESIYKMLPEEVSFKDKNGVWMTRRQFPLNLGYAITVHRSQCMTYNKLVVDLTGINWKPGMFYTILSRTRKLSDIIILAYDRKSFKVSKPALKEMHRLQKIEEEYPIKIEQYLGTKRFIEWCLPHLSNINQLSSMPSKEINTSTLDHGDVKRIKRKNSNLCTSLSLKKPESIIICENQEKNYCGRHALRALSQNLDIFSDDYLINVAQNIVASEQICRNGEFIQTTDYYYENTGDYDIQILEAALRNVLNIDLIKFHKIENIDCPIRSLIFSNTQNIQAFLVQEGYHYYCIRRFRLTKDYFF
ncbi:unnamed protein product [Rotaria socialis]|uniref:ubiquitinyl hydrolase 1 n=2 Tax=Rotaria socialis TaxID=392032 RepID=A0A818P4T3_9BILA|nr:unnamed protein product [Rotaria socialis]